MKKIILDYDKNVNRYFVPLNLLTKNKELYNINLALDPIEDFNIYVETDNHSVLIWSNDSIKKAANISFKYAQEWREFDDLYEKYYDKRWAEVPSVELSLFDWEKLQKEWKKIKEEKPEYVIFILDDSGELDKIDIVGKNELSQEDLDYMQHEHEKHLAWKKAIQLYNHDHEIIDDIWHSPQDNMFDEDIQKYLGRETGFVQHKIYTKQEVIAELQQKLKRKEPVHLIIHWLYVRKAYGIKTKRF